MAAIDFYLAWQRFAEERQHFGAGISRKLFGRVCSLAGIERITASARTGTAYVGYRAPLSAR
ncbi:hypothetical protein ACFO1B_03790 [Dactylosporangium siamense]|uniref:hypothetical protein n=1 Tax=Dactylosporangium siamense TaxID=685454 RepID=UPI001941C56F|nr:hypothetical protein [Dactylosporangium siamense]